MLAQQAESSVAAERQLALKYRQARQARREDTATRNALIEKHLPLIRSTAKKLHNANQRHTELDELANVAAIGMIDALERFEPERGYRVSTYAVPWMKNAIHAHIQEFRWQDYIPDLDYRLLMKMHRAISKLPVRFDGHVDFDQLAQALKIDVKECHRLHALTTAFISIETPLTKNGKLKLLDRLEAGKDERSPSFVAAHEQAARLIDEALKTLPDDERAAINYEFFGKMFGDYVEMGASFPHGVIFDSEQRRKLRDKALRKLKKVPGIKKAFELMKNFEDK